MDAKGSLLPEAPQFDFQPASPAIVSANLDTNGSWEEETISISYSGTGYHVPPQVVFFDPQQSAMVHQVMP